MTIPVFIEGNDGRRVSIGPEGELHVALHNHPYVQETQESFPFSQVFKNSAGSSDMRVDGSTTPQKFCVSAVSDKDIFVKTISVIIADASATLNKFGNLAALTNGVSFLYSNAQVGEITIRDGIKTNLDFIRLGIGTGAVGTGGDAWKSDLSGGGADAYLPVIDTSLVFGYTYGIHLRKGSLDNVCFYVNDDLSTGIDQFDIIAYGIQL